MKNECKKKSTNHSIGLFDSGLGGLTVVRSIKQYLPAENLVYFGDTARIPYGGKSPETILRYSIESAIFLLEKNIKLLIVACHTASAHSLDYLQKIFNIPVIGVIDAGAEYAVKVSKNKKIAVLGTRGTINSGIYEQKIESLCPEAKVIGIPCPLFVHLVEEHFIDHPATRLIVKEYLKPLRESGVDTILLGCTHYPLLKQVIQEEIGNDICIVDSAASCAEMVHHRLSEMQLHNEDSTKAHSLYYVSDDPEKFRLLAEKFLGEPIDRVETNKKTS